MTEATQGYKNTEVGTIPEDWKVVTIDSVCHIDAKALTSKTPINYSFEYISLESVSKGKLFYTKQLEFRNAPSRARKIPGEGDILFGTVRPNLQSHYLFQNHKGEFVCSTGFSVLSPYEIRSEFLFQLILSDCITKQIEAVIAGSNYPSVSSKDISELIIPYPGMGEQQSIAAALSDMDALIEAKEALLEKKRAIKQGAMQELLTGKRRLPGFPVTPMKHTEIGDIPEDWVVSELGKMLTFQCGAPFPSTFFRKDGLGLRLVRNRDLKSDDDIITYDGAYDRNYIVRNGDVLVSMDGDFMPCYWNKGVALLNQRVGRIIPKGENLAKYLYYMLIAPLRKKQEGTGATTVKHLSHSDVEKLVFFYTENIHEQRAISSVLSDMDSEIKSLEQEIANFRDLKQGMMQELLTGRIRLV